ncbi:terminase small subunit [Kerstersia gyiorum]|nr:terminase small subunit [Kerstersia gyiorum]
MALTAKQRRFVEGYLIDLNATQAAIGFDAAIGCLLRCRYTPSGQMSL